MIIGKESVKYSLKNLVQRKSRSLFTILSIFIGITTIFIFVSFGWGLYAYIGDLSSSSSADKVIIMSKGPGLGGIDTTFALTDDDIDAVERVAGVYEVTGAYFKSAQIEYRDESIYTLLSGYDPKKPIVMEVFGIEAVSGRMLRSGDDKDILLGYNYQFPDKIFDDPVPLNGKVEVNGVDFRVIGFLEEIGNPQDDAQIYITNDYMEELYDNNISYNWIVAKVELSDIDNVKERIEKELRKERDLEEGKEDFFVQTFDEMIEGYSMALDIVIGFVVLIALISVLVSAINTANTMITSVLERVKEIGIIKSIGAKNREVFGIFLFESGFLGFVAGVIGVLLGWGLSSLGGSILSNLGYGFLQPYFSPWLFVGCIAFATFTGAISGIIPAINASRTNPVDALRYE